MAKRRFDELVGNVSNRLADVEQHQERLSDMFESEEFAEIARDAAEAATRAASHGSANSSRHFSPDEFGLLASTTLLNKSATISRHFASFT